jgi:hypothetical protein
VFIVPDERGLLIRELLPGRNEQLEDFAGHFIRLAQRHRVRRVRPDERVDFHLELVFVVHLILVGIQITFRKNKRLTYHRRTLISAWSHHPPLSSFLSCQHRLARAELLRLAGDVSFDLKRQAIHQAASSPASVYMLDFTSGMSLIAPHLQQASVQ